MGATVAAPAPRNTAEAAQAMAKQIMESDPKTAMELVIKATEAARAEADLQRLEYQRQSDVEITDGKMIFKSFAGLQRVGRMYAFSHLVPEHFQGEDKVADCTIAIDLAMRCGCHPLAFLQKCYVVYGRPSIESTLAIALANRSGVLKGRIKFEMSGKGDSRACRAHAIIADGEEPIEETVTIEQAKAMGWWSKKDSLWPKMPDLMLKYRAAMWLIRANMPEVLMGLMSFDEAKDGDLGGDLAKLAAEAVPTSLDGLTAKLNGSNGNGNGHSHRPATAADLGLEAGERVAEGGEIVKDEPAPEETTQEAPAPADWRTSPLADHKAKLGGVTVLKILEHSKLKTLGDLYEALNKGPIAGLSPEQGEKVSQYINDVLDDAAQMATA